MKGYYRFQIDSHPYHIEHDAATETIADGAHVRGIHCFALFQNFQRGQETRLCPRHVLHDFGAKLSCVIGMRGLLAVAEHVDRRRAVGRAQHQVPLGVAQHQRQPEELEAEEEHQYAAVEHGRHDHGEADAGCHPQGAGAGHPRRLLNVGAEASQRRRGVEVDVRDVGQPGDHDDAGHRVEVPRHRAEQLLCPDGDEADRTDRHGVAEAEHHGGDEYRDQEHRFDPSPSRQR